MRLFIAFINSGEREDIRKNREAFLEEKMSKLKKVFFTLMTFYKTKTIIVGPDSHRLHISFKAREHKLLLSSWDSINGVKESVIDMHVEKSQNSTTYYAAIFRLKIALCRFEISEKFFLETIKFEKISHQDRNLVLIQMENYESRKDVSDVFQRVAQIEEDLGRASIKLRLID